MPFTPEELAEIQQADAEIEANFQMSNEDYALSESLDRSVKRKPKHKYTAEEAIKRKAYYQANKARIKVVHQQYYQKNKDYIDEKVKKWREQNPERIRQYRVTCEEKRKQQRKQNNANNGNT